VRSALNETACRDGGYVDGVRSWGLAHPGKRSVWRIRRKESLEWSL